MRKILMTTVLCLGVCACGVKPGAVDSPAGAEHDTFPHTYPAASTDPKPHDGYGSGY